MTLSLNTRLLLASSLVLAAFLGITGLVLDRAFRASADTALRDRLQGRNALSRPPISTRASCACPPSCQTRAFP
jgi:hypothetical protein